ncbi:MAG: nuclear transport factor 2 family protein [Acidimicrobiia bacterium]
MSEHPNIELSRRGYAAFGTGDMATLTELIADDAVWHVGGRNPLSGDYEGREAIFGFFGELGQRSESTFAIEIHDILANDEHTVVLTSLIAGGSHGKTLSTHTSDVSHIRNGQIVEFWSFTQDPYAWDDYLSD